MTKQELVDNIIRKRSFLCIGLDPDLEKMPQHLLELEDPVFEFNKSIIDATSEYAVAYKPNLAFYESLGISGYLSFEKTINFIKNNYPDQFIIADAKRGDIGNTSKKYADAFFNQLECDAITLSPYMGSDSIGPFLTYEGKWAIILALTSNKGAFDFQYLEDSNGDNLFSKVLKESSKWGTDENIMYVVGATKADMLRDIREIVPNYFLLVPGVGAQGGSLEEVVEYGITKDCGLLVNSSRGIIYAGNDKNYVVKVKEAAQELQAQMEVLLFKKGIVS